MPKHPLLCIENFKDLFLRKIIDAEFSLSSIPELRKAFFHFKSESPHATLKKNTLIKIIREHILKIIFSYIGDLPSKAIPLLDKEQLNLPKIKEVESIISNYNNIIKKLPLSIMFNEGGIYTGEINFFLGSEIEKFLNIFMEKNKVVKVCRKKKEDPKKQKEEEKIFSFASPESANCICNLLNSKNKIKSDFNLICLNPLCGRKFHSECLLIKEENLERESLIFECPCCVIEKNDPLTETKTILISPFLMNSTTQQRLIIDQKTMDQIVNDPNLGVVVKCLKIDGKNNNEHAWLDSGDLYLNNSKILDFKPLPNNSALKKRKDEKFFTRDNLLAGINILKFNFIKPSHRQMYSVRFNEKACYVVAVFLSKRISLEVLLSKLKKDNVRDIEKGRNEIKKNLDDQTNNLDQSLSLDKIIVSFVDVFDLQLIKTPAKGKYCQHLQCFSLENFLKSMENTFPKKWKCPICKIKCFDIIIEGHFLDLINKNEGASEVTFFKNDTFQIKKKDRDKKEDFINNNNFKFEEEETKTESDHKNKRRIDFIDVEEERCFVSPKKKKMNPVTITIDQRNNEDDEVVEIINIGNPRNIDKSSSILILIIFFQSNFY